MSFFQEIYVVLQIVVSLRSLRDFKAHRRLWCLPCSWVDGKLCAHLLPAALSASWTHWGEQQADFCSFSLRSKQRFFYCAFGLRFALTRPSEDAVIRYISVNVMYIADCCYLEGPGYTWERWCWRLASNSLQYSWWHHTSIYLHFSSRHPIRGV